MYFILPLPNQKGKQYFFGNHEAKGKKKVNKGPAEETADQWT